MSDSFIHNTTKYIAAGINAVHLGAIVFLLLLCMLFAALMLAGQSLVDMAAQAFKAQEKAK